MYPQWLLQFLYLDSPGSFACDIQIDLTSLMFLRQIMCITSLTNGIDCS